MGICPPVLELPTAPAQPLPQPQPEASWRKKGVSLCKAWRQLGKSQRQKGTRASSCPMAGLTLW